MEQRVSRLEGAYEQVNERLGDLTQGVASFRAETNSRFNTLLAAIGITWATMVGGFIALSPGSSPTPPV